MMLRPPTLGKPLVIPEDTRAISLLTWMSMAVFDRGPKSGRRCYCLQRRASCLMMPPWKFWLATSS